MTDAVVGAVERVAKSWRSEAKERRRISASDPVADTLEYCASELAARLRTIADESQLETVEQRAKRERVTPQTVREWIRTSQLTAQHGARGYLIPRDAQRVRRAS
jgi:hypothetical protein